MPAPAPSTAHAADDAEAVTIIRLANECDVPHVLPAAFYHFSRLQAQRRNALAPGVLRSSAARSEDFQMLLDGRERMRSHVARWAMLLEEDMRNETCNRLSVNAHTGGDLDCWRVVAHWWRGHGMTILLFGGGALDPLRVLHDLCARIHSELKDAACTSCRSWTYAEIQRQRQIIWNLLPEWFGVVPAVGT